MNPYDILGISSSATDDEVKKAYRTLSKKYHPDANIGNPQQEAYTEKFKQVQNAYKTIMDDRKRGFSHQTYTQNTQGAYGQNSYGGYSQSYNYGSDQQVFQEAAAYINAGRYQEAKNILSGVKQKNDIWFYYSALCENGLGNRIQAQEFAQTAYSMNPMNLQYMILLQQLQGTAQGYSQTSQRYGRTVNPFNCCYTLMCLNCLINSCCGAGYYGRC